MLQQYLPFTVLKLDETSGEASLCISTVVATVLTVYGIETLNRCNRSCYQADRVATVLTVYGIETVDADGVTVNNLKTLQQYLPFTVLKHCIKDNCQLHICKVATVLTVYGIETEFAPPSIFLDSAVATVLTVYGIETAHKLLSFFFSNWGRLQQYLPFTVLKRQKHFLYEFLEQFVATVLTVYGIET